MPVIPVSGRKDKVTSSGARDKSRKGDYRYRQKLSPTGFLVHTQKLRQTLDMQILIMSTLTCLLLKDSYNAAILYRKMGKQNTKCLNQLSPNPLIYKGK